jgi:hypothetical protein
MKRTILLLAALVMLIGSIDASATCWRCRFRDDTCIINAGTFSACDNTLGFCDVSGDCGVGATVNETVLATQWTVASVERLDEPHATATTAKVARIAPKPVPSR